MPINYVEAYVETDPPDHIKYGDLFRLDRVVSFDKKGKQIKDYPELIDNTEYHTREEAIEDIAARLGIDPDRIEIQS